jgi:hypothetical protein
MVPQWRQARGGQHWIFSRRGGVRFAWTKGAFRRSDAASVHQHGASLRGWTLWKATLMPRGTRGEKRPADVIGGAVKVMRIAIGEETEELAPPPTPAA